jgi:hypothetical protein
VHALQRGKNEENMKITDKNQPQPQHPGDDDLLPEYNFDYSKARPNRFAAKLESGSIIITLDPDVAEVFTTPDVVNRVLRALIATMPQSQHPQ